MPRVKLRSTKVSDVSKDRITSTGDDEVCSASLTTISETLIAQVKKISVEIFDCLSGNFLRKMEYPFLHATQLYRMI
jgi:hypothetical protein